MMMVLAWLAPTLLGTGLWQLAAGRPRSFADCCLLAGGGWMLGILLTGWSLVALHGLVDPQSVVAMIGPWLGLVGAACWVLAWRRKGLVRQDSLLHASLSPAAWALCALLLILLLLRAWWLFDESLLRPLFPWDAWAVWSIKPKTWFLTNDWISFVAVADWGSRADVFTSLAPNYPNMLAYLEVWMASGAGCWCDPAFLGLWPALWLAMLLAGFGLLRRLGVGPVAALIAVYAVGSLPSVDVHAALAGYADIWIAALFALAMLCWLHWHQQRNWRCLLLAIVFGLSLPTFKLEGAVWMLLWQMAVGLSLLSARWRLPVFAAGVALVVLGLLLGGFSLPIPGLGWVRISVDQVVVPGMPGFDLVWHPVLSSVADVLFLQPNWHLLFYLAPLVLVARWRRFCRVPGSGLLAVSLAGGLLFLFVLFFLTDAAAWALNYTSVNRLVLHIAPALTWALALGFAAPVAEAKLESAGLRE